MLRLHDNDVIKNVKVFRLLFKKVSRIHDNVFNTIRVYTSTKTAINVVLRMPGQ